MEKMVRKAIIRYLKKHFPGKEKKIIRKADAILPKLKAKAPDMGGKENPLAYAKKYGYMELMPHMCALDHTYAKLMHAKLIRTHTVATGADSCDYWYVPDRSRTARNYKGKIV